MDFGEYDWPGHPSGGGGDQKAERLIKARAEGKLACFGVVSEAKLSYEYNDYALVREGKDYFLLNTSGCSCPSPTETWGISVGPATLNDVWDWIVEAHASESSGIFGKQFEEFLVLVVDAVTQDRDAFTMPDEQVLEIRGKAAIALLKQKMEQENLL